jgi:hypothetical protein
MALAIRLLLSAKNNRVLFWPTLQAILRLLPEDFFYIDYSIILFSDIEYLFIERLFVIDRAGRPRLENTDASRSSAAGRPPSIHGHAAPSATMTHRCNSMETAEFD